jgi:hypothetical protein
MGDTLGPLRKGKRTRERPTRCFSDAAINITIARDIALVATTTYNRYDCEKLVSEGMRRSLCVEFEQLNVLAAGCRDRV